MEIALFHKHYNQKHLDAVRAEMLTLGAPKIRCIWDAAHEVWLAVEGCHRLRAAHDLGIEPVIIDVTENETVTVQIDEEDRDVNTLELADDLQSDMCQGRTVTLSF